MTCFSGSHFSVVLASTNGSLLVWCARPAKFTQPLAPNFIEIEENVVYVEREDEFESETSGDEGMKLDLEQGLEPLSKKQLKLLEPIDLSF